jgi:threonine dehydratase
MLRFREAVAGGSIPFTVQGPENALALDGGRTLGWEIADQASKAGLERPDRVLVQVGGGALAACVGSALRDRFGASHLQPVEAAGCAPLARAWRRAGDAIDGGVRHVAQAWGELMTPWEDPHSIADGILDDETYDWLGIVDTVGPAGRPPVVASEEDIVAAHQLARTAGFDVSPTGSAGLAGVLAAIESIQPTERVVVIMSGIAR